MRFATTSSIIAALVAGFAPSTRALLVAKGSQCASKCGNVLDSTSDDELVCSEDGYGSSSGLVFKNCVQCELSSTYQTISTEYDNNAETDTQWALYNLRYATATCFFGFGRGDPPANPCLTETACEGFKKTVEYADLQKNVSSYDYCTTWNFDQLPKCIACLRAGQNNYISNFLATLGAACQQQPIPGRRVGIEGDPFSKDHVNASDANTLPTLSADYFKQGPFGLGAKVGVAVGALAFVLLVAGVSVVCIGKRRRKNYLKRYEARHGRKNWAGMVAPPTRELHDTPLSQRPLRGWDDTPLSAATDGTMEKQYPRYFSPYSSQYNSPVSAVDQPGMLQWPTEKSAAIMSMMSRAGANSSSPSPPPHPQPRYLQEIGIALGGESQESVAQNFEPPSPAKGKEREEQYEMHEVESDGSYGSREGYGQQNMWAAMPHEPQPPVLHHPGYGRSNESLPRRYPTHGGELYR